jgi:Fic family protein
MNTSIIYPLSFIDVSLANALETKVVLKRLKEAHRFLAELKGVAQTIPNQSLLINTLSLQEAKDSSEVENIITTHDELYLSEPTQGRFDSIAAKEVHAYAKALRLGYDFVQKTGLLTINHIQQIQACLENNDAGFRTQSGTVLKNEHTGEVVYTPPQHPDEVLAFMNNLEIFIHDATPDIDPLIKMAILHHQFESIHPFYDGNGRTGRILNILYLVKEGLLDSPVLYLSRYINQNKALYYEQLQAVRLKPYEEAWEPWVLFMLDGIIQTSQHTIKLVIEIRKLMVHVKHHLRQTCPKLYSQDLLNHLFVHPYTKRPFFESELGLSRPTATRYLTELANTGVLDIHTVGRQKIYVNRALFELLCHTGMR